MIDAEARNTVSDAIACVMAMEHNDPEGMAAMFSQYAEAGELGELVLAILSVAHSAVHYAAHVTNQEPARLLAGAIAEVRSS